MKEAIKLNPALMALLLKGIKQHLENPNDRCVIYQIAVGKELYARLLESVPKEFIDEFINSIFDIGLNSWMRAVIRDNFDGNEALIDDLARFACEEERNGKTLH